MRILIALTSSLLSCSALASDLCKDLMACGTYEIVPTGGENENVTKIVISKTGEYTASLEFGFTDSAGQHTNTMALSFDNDGAFKGIVNGNLGATGICNGKICTYSLYPNFSNEIGYYGVAGVIRFLPNGLEYSKFAIGDPGPFQSTVLLPRK